MYLKLYPSLLCERQPLGGEKAISTCTVLYIYIYCSCDFSVDMLGRRKYAHVTEAMWHEIAFLHYEKGMSTKEITGWYNGVPSKATINRRLAEYRLQGGKYITVGQ